MAKGITIRWTRNRPSNKLMVSTMNAIVLAIGMVLVSVASADNKERSSIKTRSIPSSAVTEDVSMAHQPGRFQPNQIIVAFATHTSDSMAVHQQSSKLALDYNLQLMATWSLKSIAIDCAVFAVADALGLNRVVRAIEQLDGVQFVVRNQRYTTLQSTYNDPYAQFQNSLDMIGAAQVHAWSTGKNIKVAVVDTGMDTAHPDLSKQVIDKVNFVVGGDDEFSADQHGTAVAGIIAATADDGIGIFGVAPQAKLLAAKACWYELNGPDNAICSSSTLARAIDYAIESGAHVINLSLGGSPDDLITQLLDKAFARGIITVAAAGTLGSNSPMFPASLPTTIAVVSSDEVMVSNRVSELPPQWRNSGLVVSAPGHSILTTTPNRGYNFLSGSSLSTAHVSGAVALLLERTNRGPKQIFKILDNSLDSSPSTGATKVDTLAIDVCSAMKALQDNVVCTVSTS